jgi:hypothetical protein
MEICYEEKNVNGSKNKGPILDLVNKHAWDGDI